MDDNIHVHRVWEQLQVIDTSTKANTTKAKKKVSTGPMATKWRHSMSTFEFHEEWSDIDMIFKFKDKLLGKSALNFKLTQD